jgi:hypothetical protein
MGIEKVLDEKTLVRLGQAIGPETIRELHDRVVALARQRGVIRGRKMRVDTTVVETNVHHPTDSGLLNDGSRTLTRTMKKIEGKAGGLKKTRAQNFVQEGEQDVPVLSRLDVHGSDHATGALRAQNGENLPVTFRSGRRRTAP